MSFTESLPDRLRASGIHLAGSSLLFVIYIYLVLVNWYPEPFFTIEGAIQVTVTLIGVDLVVGPLLTFVVYVKNKKGLKFDLSLIIITQLAFLLWGIWVTYKEHPVYTVFSIDQFHVMRAGPTRSFAIEPHVFAGQPKYGLRMVYALPPQNEKDKQALIRELILGRGDIYNLSERYRNIRDYRKAVIAKSRDINKIMQARPDIHSDMDSILERYENASLADFVYLPIEARKKYYTLVLKKTDLSYAGYLDVDAWVYDES